MLALVLVGAILYALLPWLIPKQWLADRIAAEIARVMNRGARIDRLDIGWAKGVLLEGLTIDERPGFGEGPFVRVRRVQTDFSPIAALLGRPIARLNLNEPEVWIVILTENGVQKLNIADLGQEGTQAAPRGEWSAWRAAVHIVEEYADPPPEGRPRRSEVALRLGQLTCRLDARTGTASWDIRGQAPSSRESRPGIADGIATEGELLVPKLKKGVELSGGGRIQWHRLDLSSVPVHLIPGTSLQRMTGWSAGALEVRVHEDLRIDWSFQTDLQDVSVYRRGRDQPSRLDRADLTTKGRWDPTADVLIFDELDGHVPGLHVRTSEPARDGPIRLALRSEHRIDMNLTGEADDLDRLRRSVPEMDILLGPQTQTRGGCRFELSWARTTLSDRLRFRLDGQNAEIIRPERVCIPAGDPVSLRLDLRVDRRAERLEVEDVQVRLGPLALWARGHAPWNLVGGAKGRADQTDETEDLWSAVLPRVRGELHLSAQPADRLVAYLPCLAERFRDVRLTGPMFFSMGLESDQSPAEDSVLWCHASVPESSTLTVGEVFVKPMNQPLSGSARLVFDRRAPTVARQVGVDLHLGPSRIRVDPAMSRARLSVQRTEPQEGGTPPIDDADRLVAHGHLAATLHIEKVESLLDAMPELARRFETDQPGHGLKGDCTVRLESNLACFVVGGNVRPGTWRVHAAVEASKLGIDWGQDLSKPAGSPAAVVLDYLFDHSLTDLQHRYDLSFKLAGLGGQGALAWGGGREQVWVDMDVSNVDQALGHAPSLRNRLSEFRLKGGASVAFRSQRDPRRHVLSFTADAGSLGVYISGRDPIDKPPGVPCRLAATVESLPEIDPSVPHEMTIREVLATIASCQFRAIDGRIVTQPGTHEKLTGDYIARNPRWWVTGSPLQEVALSTVGTVVMDSTLRSLCPAVDRLAQKYDLMGVAEAAVRLGIDRRGVRLAGRVDADRINLNASPHLVKAPGTRLRIAFDLASREPSGREGSTTEFVLHECDVEAWDMRFSGTGDFWLQHDPEGGTPRLGGFTLSAGYQVPQLAHLQKMMPTLPSESLAGSLTGNVSLAAEGDQFRLGPSSLAAKNVVTRLGKTEVEIDGQMEVSSDRIDCDELRVRVGRNGLKLAAHVEQISQNPRGSVFLIADDVDLDELRRFLDDLQPSETSSRPGDEDRIIKAQPVFEFLKRCDLAGRAHIGQARLTGEKTRKVFTVQELISDFKVAAGRVVVPFTCAMNGGLVDGEFALTADERNPYFDLKYKAVKVGAEDDVRAMVLYDFPGLHATGPVTLIDSTRQRFFNEPGVLNYPVGEGEWIIDGGAYVGRSAPLWLTRIFPGLNTARYEFTRMHDWFKKHADGRIDHHMVYRGAYYNVYMKGYSLPDGQSYYEVGIDLLAGYESKYWSETGQGRVALFTADALVQDGVEVRKDIRFVPLHRVIYDVFLRSNVVTAAYYTIKKQVTKQP